MGYWIGVLTGVLSGAVLGYYLSAQPVQVVTVPCPDMTFPSCPACPSCPASDSGALSSCIEQLTALLGNVRSAAESRDDCILTLTRCTADTEYWRNKYLAYTCD